MSYEWIDPTPGNSCPTCQHFAGHVFSDGEQLPLPAHPGCECFYIYTDAAGTAVNWDEQPDHARNTYTYYAAWILRQGDELPPSLQPLQPAAEAYNRSKEQPAMNQTRLLAYAPPTAVDTNAHILRGVAVIQAVEALGHGFLIDDIALHQINDLGQAARNGIKSRFTHPGLSSDGLGKFLGRVKDFRIVGDKVLGDLHLSAVASKSPHGDLRAYVEELAATDPESFGMSVVITGRRVWELENGRVIEADGDEASGDDLTPPANATSQIPLFRVHSLDAVDAVDEPAANRDGFFAHTTSTLAADIFGRLDTLLQSLNIAPALYPKLLSDFVHGRPIPAPLSTLIDELTTDYDIQPDKAKSFAAQYATTRLSRPVPLGSGVITLTAVTEPQQGAFTMSGLTPDPVALPETAVTNPANTADAWMQSIQQTAVSAKLSNSGLPQRTRERLAQATYATPEALDAAISQSREELAEIAQANVIDFGGKSPRISGMRTDLDRAQSNVDWFFGVEGAEAPAYNLRRFDQLYVALTGDVNFTGLFDRAHAELAASPVTLPDLALNAMNKVVIQQFSLLAFWRWYEKVAVVTPNDGSLQDMAWISIGGTGNLPAVADGAAYTEGNIADVRENDAFGKYGRYVGITRAMIKNSDIQRIQAVTKALAIDSVRTRSANIAAIFTQASGTGPTLDQDSTVLFHSNHSNVQTTALGTSVTAWEAASLECFNGTEIGSGKKIGTFAKYLLVPSALYFQGLANFGYGDGYPTAYNPHAVSGRSAEDPRPEVLAVPDWTDATDWAYLADPRIFPVIHMSYSADPSGRAHPMPELFSVVSETAGMMFTNDTLPIKVRDEYAFGVNGYRGIGKRNVA